MSDSSYHIKRIGAEDFSMLIPLMKNCFGMDADIDYFRWKYTSNPAGSFIGFVAIATGTGEIGGYYGVIPQVFELDGKIETIYQSCDTMTHSDHRRRGLFRRLATRCYSELKEEGKFFVIGFGGGQSTPGFLKFGWKRIFDFRYYFKPSLLSQFSHFRKLNTENLTVTGALTAVRDGLDMARPGIRSRAKGHRTPEQIAWRLSNPYHEYRAARLKDDPKTYLIYYVQSSKIIVLDLHFNRKESGRALMTFLDREVLKHGFKGIIAFCQEHGPDASIFKQHGFISNPMQRGPLHECVPFIFFSTDARMKQYLSPSDWIITSYDHDSL